MTKANLMKLCAKNLSSASQIFSSSFFCAKRGERDPLKLQVTSSGFPFNLLARFQQDSLQHCNVLLDLMIKKRKSHYGTSLRMFFRFHSF
jgi:hypothetical protein